MGFHDGQDNNDADDISLDDLEDVQNQKSQKIKVLERNDLNIDFEVKNEQVLDGNDPDKIDEVFNFHDDIQDDLNMKMTVD